MFIFKNGPTEFAIQVVEGLGTFVEYEEDETMKGLTEREKIAKMLNTLKNLGLKIGENFSCKKVYLKFKGQK